MGDCEGLQNTVKHNLVFRQLSLPPNFLYSYIFNQGNVILGKLVISASSQIMILWSQEELVVNVINLKENLSK